MSQLSHSSEHPGRGSSIPKEASLPNDLAIELAPIVDKLSPIPTTLEIAKYQGLSQAIRSGTRLSPTQFATTTRAALELRQRLTTGTEHSGIGGIPSLALRLEWVSHAHKTILDITPQVEALYQQPPQVIVQTALQDFVHRLRSLAPQLTGSHAGTGVSAALEQTRLMLIFAAKALKSGDHVQTALGGLKGKGFADVTEQPAKAQDRSSSDRQAAFAARQAERAKATEERKAALKAGSSVASRDLAPKAPIDTEKAALLEQTARTHTDLTASATPTNEQRQILKLRPTKELELRLSAQLTAPSGVKRHEELESVRTEMVNILASRLRDWFNTEVQLAKNLGKDALSLSEVPLNEVAARERKVKFEADKQRLDSLLSLIEADLKRLAITAAQSASALKDVLSTAEFAALHQVLNPPKPKEVYELAD